MSMTWLKVFQNAEPDDVVAFSEALVIEYEEKLIELDGELKLEGRLISNVILDNITLTDYRYRQFQALDLILECLNSLIEFKKDYAFRDLLENHHMKLQHRDAIRFANGDSNIYQYIIARNNIAFIRGQYLARIKAIEQRGYGTTTKANMEIAKLKQATM